MIRPRQLSENVLIRNSRKRSNLINKYRDYIRHLTKTYNLSDEDLDDFVLNWNNTYDISQMSLSLIDEEDEDEQKPKKKDKSNLHFS